MKIENINLIRKLAWSFHASTGIDYEELFSESCLAYCEAIRTFDENKNCKFTTFAWNVITNHLILFTSKEKNRPEICFSHCTAEFKSLTYQPEIGSDFLMSLPEECREIAKIIFTSLDDVPDDTPPKIIRGKVVELLRKEGWSWSRIWDGFKLMKLSLN